MKIKDGFIKRKIGSKYLVATTGELSKQNNIMIELNDTSSQIWDGVAKGFSENDIANALVEKYEIPFDKALNDVKTIIDQMKNNGVFE